MLAASPRNVCQAMRPTIVSLTMLLSPFIAPVDEEILGALHRIETAEGRLERLAIDGESHLGHVDDDAEHDHGEGQGQDGHDGGLEALPQDPRGRVLVRVGDDGRHLGPQPLHVLPTIADDAGDEIAPDEDRRPHADVFRLGDLTLLAGVLFFFGVGFSVFECLSPAISHHPRAQCESVAIALTA